MCKKIIKNLILFLGIWIIIFLFFLNYYTPSKIVITDLSLLPTNGRIFDESGLILTNKPFVTDPIGKKNLLSRFTDSLGNKIGIGLLEYNIFIENNYKLAFESETAQPSLAYAPSILTIVSSDGENQKIAYSAKKGVFNSIKRNEFPNIINSILLETETSPQPKQIYSPNSLITVSAVGNLIMSPQLNTYSKINIGFSLFVVLLALLNWFRGLMQFLLLGPEKFFLKHD